MLPNNISLNKRTKDNNDFIIIHMLVAYLIIFF